MIHPPLTEKQKKETSLANFRIKRLQAALASDARVETILIALLTPCNGLESGTTDQLIDLLTDSEGDSLTFQSKNVDFNDQPNECVTVNADWTNWQDQRFAADTRQQCLEMALQALRARLSPSPTGGRNE